MTRHNNKKTLRSATAAIALAAALSAPGVARAGAPVIDTSSLAQLKEQVTTGMNQLKEITELKSLAEEQLAAFGEFGIMKDLLGGAAFANLGSKADFYDNMQRFGFDPCAINLCQVGENNAAMTDIEEARGWTKQTFFTSVPLDNEKTRDLQEVRRRGVVYASTNALALAATVHTDLAGAGETAKSLEEIVQSSENLRGDVRANSAIALASYKVQVQQLAMLTAMLDVEAMTALTATGLYHEEGGTAIPDAFIDSDFTGGTDRRTRVTAPEKGSPSGGGSPFGGDVFGSLLNGSNPISGLASSLAGGKLPGLAPNMTEGGLFADGLASASNILRGVGGRDVAGALDLIQGGISTAAGAGAQAGAPNVLVGAGSALAKVSGNDRLSQLLNVASGAVRTGNATTAGDFARGAAADLLALGNKAASDYLNEQVARLGSGLVDPKALVLDASTLLARTGPDANVEIADLLALDTTRLDPKSLQDIARMVVETVAAETNNTALTKVASKLGEIDSQLVAELNEAVRANQAASQAPASPSPSGNIINGQ